MSNFKVVEQRFLTILKLGSLVASFTTDTMSKTNLTPKEENLINKELVPHAGKIELDPPMMWGKGLITEMRESFLQWWVAVSSNARVCNHLPLQYISR